MRDDDEPLTTPWKARGAAGAASEPAKKDIARDDRSERKNEHFEYTDSRNASQYGSLAGFPIQSNDEGRSIRRATETTDEERTHTSHPPGRRRTER